MKSYVRWTFLLLLCATSGYGQDSIRAYRHLPFGVTFSAGIAQTNFSNLNQSDTYVASVDPFYLNVGVGFYFGVREKFFGSINFSRRHYTNPIEFNYHNAQINTDFTEKINSDIRHFNIDLLLYKPVVSGNRTTVFAFTGFSFAKTMLGIYKRDSQSINGLSSKLDFTTRQNWNLNVGLMFDFLKTEAISNYSSLGFKVGYVFPLTKAQWSLAGQSTDNMPSVNMSGVYGTIYWNLF